MANKTLTSLNLTCNKLDEVGTHTYLIIINECNSLLSSLSLSEPMALIYT